jgi:hypothetical protein
MIQKDYLNKSCIFFKINYHTTFEDPITSGNTVAPISQVHMSAILLVLTAGNDITFVTNFMKFGQLIQKLKGTQTDKHAGSMMILF